MLKTISVIICTKNRIDDFKKTIESLILQNFLPNEVIVVDASENEDVFKYLEIINTPFQWSYVHSKPGLTHQRNIGLNKSRGEVIFFFDDDVELQPTYIDFIVKIFEADLSLSIGAVGGRIVNSQTIGKMTLTFWIKRKLFNVLRFIFMQEDFGNGRFRYSGMPTYPHLLKTSQYIECLSGCCMAFRRESLQKIKFDENLPGYGLMEDVDISKQILDAGYKIYYQASATLIHNESPMNRLKIQERAEMSIVNYDYLFRKNWSKEKWRWLFYYWTLLGLVTVNLHNYKGLQGTFSGLKKVFTR